ncbi:MAG: HAD family phosphatase [Acidobacteriota bacterium]|nr:HAD family phosphatase [Acidobacteriota bacterium]
MPIWFLFDLGNTLIKLAYERVLENIRRSADVTRDQLIDILEAPGSYRDMERGAVSFSEFYQFLREQSGYRGSLRDFQKIWSDFFDGTVPGAEDFVERVRTKYRVAFLSNSNEVHAELIPKKFPSLFRKDDRFIFSYRFKVAKPDPEIFRRACEILGTLPAHVVFVDDLLENVLAARAVGMTAYQFIDTPSVLAELERDNLL